MRNAYGNRLAAIMLPSVPVIIYATIYLYPLLTVARQSADNSSLYKQFQTLADVIDGGSADERAAALLSDLIAANWPRRRAISIRNAADFDRC